MLTSVILKLCDVVVAVIPISYNFMLINNIGITIIIILYIYIYYTEYFKFRYRMNTPYYINYINS